MQKFMRNLNSETLNGSVGVRAPEIPEIDFTENLRGRKFLKFPVWYVVLFLVQHSLEIFISLIFYVKSILENLEVQQNAILAISGALKSHQIKCSVFRNAKMADFECLDLPTLISRKI